MKKLLTFFLLGLLVFFFGCDGTGNNIEDHSEFFDDIENSSDLKEAFQTAVYAKITDEFEKTVFATDFFLVTYADVSAATYLAVVELYLLTPQLTNANIEKSGDTYTITDDDGVVKIKVDEATNSYVLELWQENKLVMLSESVKFGDNHYAYQAYFVDDSSKMVIQLLINEDDGKLSVKKDVTAQPTSIYKAKSVPTNFASEGVRVYTYSKGQYSFEGSFDSPAKTVTNIAIKTGLKESYELNETLTLTGIVLTVTYNDFSSEEINLTTAMIIGTAPNTTSAGTKTLTIKIGDVQKSFTFTVVDTSQPQKQVKAMEIVSGLNETYDVNDPFDITDIQIKITFDDDSETTLYVTSSMVVGTAPNTQTTGTKTLTLKYQGYQESFTFTVVEAVLTPCEKLIESLEDFYQVLIYGDQNFFFSLSSMAMLSYENLDVMEFALDFIDDISDSWSNFTLVFQAKNVLVAYEEGMLELLFSSPSEDYGKTPYVNYDEASKTFQIGYWFEKSYVYYWFEQEILFDEATDSLKATTSVGVDDAAEIYGSVEYNQISPGAYAGNLYFPVEGNEDSNLYTNYEFQFTATTGVIAKNLWANRPTSIYKIESGLADYGTEGDYVLTMTEDELTLESTLSCPAADFFYAFSDINEENSIEAKFLERMIQLTKDSEDYYFGAYNYYLSGSDLAYYMYMLEYYEKKTFDFSEFYSINITVNGNTTTFTVDYDGEVETYSFSFTNNHLSFTYTTNYYVSMVEIVQEKNTYYMQKVEGSDDYYNVYQAIYVHDDKMNMCFSHSETDTLPNSIFNGPDEGFASTGDEVFMVVKGTVTYIG